MAADTGIYPTYTDGSVYTDAGNMPRIDEPHCRFGSRVELSRTAQRGIFTARDDFVGVFLYKEKASVWKIAVLLTACVLIGFANFL